jgi:hypothetical protein
VATKIVCIQYWGQELANKSLAIASYAVEPLLPSAWLSPGRTSDSAYPPTSSRNSTFFPSNLYFAWTDKAYDEEIHDAIKASVVNIQRIAIEDGQTLLAESAPKYPNNAVYDTPLKDMYAENVDRLKALKARIDPYGVMDLAGGFKF